jgi:hypothetical protein
MITPTIHVKITSDNGCSQGKFSWGARAPVDTPVHAHSPQAVSQFSERRGCSSDTGVHTLSACGGQGEKAAVVHHFIGHDNSRVGFGATIPKGCRSLGMGQLGRNLWSRFSAIILLDSLMILVPFERQTES